MSYGWAIGINVFVPIFNRREQAVEMIRIFIGYDTREPVAFNVCTHSILQRASKPVSISAVMLSQLSEFFTRPVNALQSTQFAFSRFLVPYLCNYEGWAIFIDGDMIVRRDIAELWRLRDERYTVQVVKHAHVPKETVKFLGATQTRYEKKNWSSVMLLNNARATALTPEYVNKASGLELHQFKWLKSEEEIGTLPHTWNHLVGFDAENPHAALVHYTTGGPYFEEYRNCEHAGEWFQESDAMMFASRNVKTSVQSA